MNGKKDQSKKLPKLLKGSFPSNERDDSGPNVAYLSILSPPKMFFFTHFPTMSLFLNLNAFKDTKAAEGLVVEVAEGLHLDLDLDLAAGADGR